MRLTTLVALIFASFSIVAQAQTFETPKALLEAFYAPYFTGEFGEDDRAFLSRSLNEIYNADMEATPEGEMGALSFDPFVNGQDYELSDLEVGEPAIEGDRAEVEVRFDNFGRGTVLSYELVREDGGWRIDDVVSERIDSRYRLTEIFAAAK